MFCEHIFIHTSHITIDTSTRTERSGSAGDAAGCGNGRAGVAGATSYTKPEATMLSSSCLVVGGDEEAPFDDVVRAGLPLPSTLSSWNSSSTTRRSGFRGMLGVPGTSSNNQVLKRENKPPPSAGAAVLAG